MTSDDIIRMAREAGATPYTNRHYPDRPVHTFNPEQLAAFAELVRKDYSTTHASLWLDRIHKFMLAEREACAEYLEKQNTAITDMLAAEIRARGQA